MKQINKIVDTFWKYGPTESFALIDEMCHVDYTVTESFSMATLATDAKNFHDLQSDQRLHLKKMIFMIYELSAVDFRVEMFDKDLKFVNHRYNFVNYFDRNGELINNLREVRPFVDASVIMYDRAFNLLIDTIERDGNTIIDTLGVDELKHISKRLRRTLRVANHRNEPPERVQHILDFMLMLKLICP